MSPIPRPEARSSRDHEASAVVRPLHCVPDMPIVPVVIASIAIGIFAATLRLGTKTPRG